jgi:DNA-binding GntR family transcriptional regulator
VPLPRKLHAPERSLMREEVYEALRGWIVDGVLLPGEKMRDTELARKLRVSRTPVREALRRLEDEGLVESSAHRWTRVSTLDAGDAHSVYPIIWSLEALAIELAGPRIAPEDLRAMEEANSELDDAVRSSNAPGASAADARFHGAFVRRSGNGELIKILDQLKVKLRRLELAYFDGSLAAAQSVAEHGRVIRALRDGDYEAAARATRQNWERSLERIVRRGR